SEFSFCVAVSMFADSSDSNRATGQPYDRTTSSPIPESCVFAPLPVVTVLITQPPFTARPRGSGALFAVAPAPAVSVAPSKKSYVAVVEADCAAEAPGYRPSTLPLLSATWIDGSGV